MASSQYKIKYRLQVTENSAQGLVFGKPSLTDKSNPKDIDGLSLTDIFDLISKDDGLMSILANRQDTPEGVQSIFAAQSTSEAYAQKLKTTSLNESVIYDKVKKIETEFTNNLTGTGTGTVITNGNYPEIPELNTQLPPVDQITINNRINSLIGVYKILKGKITDDNLFSVGKTMGTNNTMGLHLPDISYNDFKDKDKLLGLKSLLFFVAKTFMRIPIVLLVASMHEQGKTEKDIDNNYSILEGHTLPSVLMQRLKSDIYPKDIKTSSSPPSSPDTLLLQAISRNIEAKTIYSSYTVQKSTITIDMLCYILLYIKKSQFNFDNLIVFFCERLIYIITYWCGSPPINYDHKLTGDKTMNSWLGYLHQSTVTEKTTGKTKNLVSALQKMHNENDKLISFVKLRKGKTTMVPDEKQIKDTRNDGLTMNIRYSGIHTEDAPPSNTDTQVKELTPDNKILQFRYTDTVKSLYREFDRVTKTNGSKTTVYKKFNEQIVKSVAEPGYEPWKESGITKEEFDNKIANGFEYNHEFHAGPFTQIYNETFSNEQIVNDTVFQQKIYNKLTGTVTETPGTVTETPGTPEPKPEPEPVCIIGYGASGSGKTSVLIKLQTPDGVVQEGILMLLSKKIGTNTKNTKCEVTVQEFGIDFGGTKFINPEAFKGTYTYNSTDNAWVVLETSGQNPGLVPGVSKKWEGGKNDDKDEDLKSTHGQTLDSKSDSKSVSNPVTTSSSKLEAESESKSVPTTVSNSVSTPGSNSVQTSVSTTVSTTVPPSEPKSGGGTFSMNGREICTFGNMFDDIIYYMDYERNVAKTPNNPVSSRSHIIICLKYSSTDSTSPPFTLFICDLAGVENSFDCSKIGDNNDEQFKTIPQKVKDVENCTNGDKSNNPYEPIGVFGKHEPMFDTVIPFDPSKNEFDIKTKPLNTRLHYAEYQSNNQNLKNEIDKFMKDNNKTLKDNNKTLMTNIQTVSKNLPKFSYALSNLQFPLGNYCKAIKEFCVTPKSTEIAAEIEKAKKESRAPIFSTPNQNIQDFFSIITELNALKLEPSTGTVTVTHAPSNKKYKIDDATGNDRCVTEEPPQPLEFYIKGKSKKYPEQGMIDIELLVSSHKRYLTNKQITGKNALKYDISYFRAGMVESIIKNHPNLIDLRTNLTDLISSIYTSDYATTLTDNPSNESLIGFVNELNKKAIELNIMNPNTKKNPQNTKLVTTLPVRGEGIETVTYTPIGYGIDVKLGTSLLSTFRFDDDSFKDKQDDNPNVTVEIPFPQQIIDTVCYKLNGDDVDKPVQFEPLKNTYTNIKISAEDVITNVFEQNENLNNFIEKYKLLLIELYNLKYPENTITGSKLYPFVFYLKQNLLNIHESNPEYNAFQLQILIEQLYFRNINQNATPPILYDYYDEELDKNPTINGGMAGGGNKESCNSRTAEGVYINSSLKDMRMDIARHVMSGKSQQNLPSFYSRCLPIQCNPEFKNCMGVDKYPNPTNPNISPPKQTDGDLVAAIKNMCGDAAAANLVFCVFCVFNLSEPPLVKDPPPVPYVDITKLQQYNEILENISVESFRDVDSILVQIKDEVDALRTSGPFIELKMNLNTLFDQFSTETDLTSIRTALSKIIDIISTSNAATPIGTILFTDAVAKNFAQVNTCNVKQQLKFTDYKYTAEPKSNTVGNTTKRKSSQSTNASNQTNPADAAQSKNTTKPTSQQKQTPIIDKDQTEKAFNQIKIATDFIDRLKQIIVKGKLLTDIALKRCEELITTLTNLPKSNISHENQENINELVVNLTEYQDPKYYVKKK